jgi:hypothetical protein
MPDSVRHLQKFEDSMKRYLGDIDRAVYSAEILCSMPHKGAVCLVAYNTVCPFRVASSCNIFFCRIYSFRTLLGDHVKQDPIGVHVK